MKIMKNIVIYSIIGVVFLMVSCKKEGRVTGVKVEPNKIEIKVGDSKNLSATVLPSNATEQTVYWMSENKNIVSVSSSGKITGQGSSGTKKIGIRASTMEGEFVDWCYVTVNFGNYYYTATGTPLTGYVDPAPNSWLGYFVDVPDISSYGITNWANSSVWVEDDAGLGLIMILYYENGKIYLDTKSIVEEFKDYYFYFSVGYVDGGSFYESPSNYKYEVKYNKDSKIFDFTGTYEGKSALIIGKAVDKTSGDIIYAVETGLFDTKIMLQAPINAPEKSLIKNDKLIEKSDNAVGNSGKIIPLEKFKSIKELNIQKK